MVVEKELSEFGLSTRNRITKVIWILTEEHIEDHHGVFISVKEKGIRHRELIEIDDHRRVVVIFVWDIRGYFNGHFYFLLL